MAQTNAMQAQEVKQPDNAQKDVALCVRSVENALSRLRRLFMEGIRDNDHSEEGIHNLTARIWLA